MQILTIVVFVITISYVHSGLLKVPKIYNAVITSDANLEPSRTYPIVQPVLSVGVQPVIAAAAIPAVPHPIEKQHSVQHGGYYPYTLGGLYPFLSGSNNLYPTVYYQQQAQYAPGIYHQQPQAQEQQPYSQEQHAYPQEQHSYPQEQPPQHEQSQLQPQEPPRQQELPSSAVQVPDSSHHHADPFNNHHRFKNPGIPDVPPPPLPVSSPKKSS